MGAFLFDLHPRSGKYGHQCVFPLTPAASSLVVGGSDSASKGGLLPEVVNIGNLTPATGDTPALMAFEEVVTLFHEFGT